MEFGTILIILALVLGAMFVAIMRSWKSTFVEEGRYVRYCKVCNQKFLSEKARPSVWVEDGPLFDVNCRCHATVSRISSVG